MTSRANADYPGLPASVPGQVTTLTQFVAKQGHEASVRDALLSLVEPSRAETGNVTFDVHEHRTMPWAFYIVANWLSEAALDRHVASDHVHRVLGTAEAALAAPQTQVLARMLSNPDPNRHRARPAPGSSSEVTLVPFFTIKPGHVDTVRDAHLRMVDPTRADPGCLDYDLYQSVDNPATMFFYENWIDQKSLDRHMNSPAFHQLVRGKIDPLLAVPWTALTMSMLSQPLAGAGPG
jgi:quinol monooxygenase YgiN